MVEATGFCFHHFKSCGYSFAGVHSPAFLDEIIEVGKWNNELNGRAFCIGGRRL
jgi:hypothetical protein